VIARPFVSARALLHPFNNLMTHKSFRIINVIFPAFHRAVRLASSNINDQIVEFDS